MGGVAGVESEWNIADSTIAVGPESIVLSTNTVLAIKSKDGTTIASTRLIELFAPVLLEGAFAGDPVILFDTLSQRFFMVAMGRVVQTCTMDNCDAFLFLAVSTSERPQGFGPQDWHVYALDNTIDYVRDPVTGDYLPSEAEKYADRPTLGVTEDWVLITTQQLLSPPAHETGGDKIRIIDKGIVLVGNPLEMWRDIVTRMDESFFSAMQPAVMQELADIPLFMIGKSSSGECWPIWGLTDLSSNPQMQQAPPYDSRLMLISSCTHPPPSPQPGGGVPLDVGFYPVQSPLIYARGSLWFSTTVPWNFGSGTVAAVYWAQVDVRDWPQSVQIMQEGIVGEDGVWSYYPALVVDKDDDVYLVFNRSGPQEYASIYFVGRDSNDPPGMMRSPFLLKAGTVNQQNPLANDNRNGTPVKRFADYSGIALDPVDGTVWIMGQYMGNTQRLTTWVGHLTWD